MDKKTDISGEADRGEPLGLMEPLLISESGPNRTKLQDLAMDLASHSTGLCRSLPKGITQALSDLVRSMNCYYSNLIEGHHTHPVEIERALKNDFSQDPEKRDLQLEAKAHIATQQWIDQGGLGGDFYTIKGLCEIHRRFTELLPEDLRFIADPDSGKRLPVVPGKFRQQDVKVGHHVPLSPGALPRFMKKFEETYKSQNKSEAILTAGIAHHRLLWIHPFLDGNGRVARLMSYALFLAKLDTGGLWSIARGLARKNTLYKQHLMNCDLKRRNDLDGRGHLSEAAMMEFSEFFLATCLDQVKFMEGLMQPDRLRARILIWAKEEAQMGELPDKVERILEALLYRGELPRGEVAAITGTGERQARRIVSSLMDKEVLVSKSSRAPLHLAFPAKLATRWMPGLFPDQD